MPVFLLLTCIPIELAPLVNVVKKNKNAIRIPLNYLFFATLTRQIFLPFRFIKIEAPVITILINCLPDYHPTDSSKKQLSNRFPISPPLLSDTRIIRGWFRGTRLTETRGATKRGKGGKGRRIGHGVRSRRTKGETEAYIIQAAAAADYADPH